MGWPPDMEASCYISWYPGRISRVSPNGGAPTRKGRVASGTATPTKIPHVSANKNIMRAIAAFKAVAMVWNPWQIIPLCFQGVHMDQELCKVSPTENLEG